MEIQKVKDLETIYSLISNFDVDFTKGLKKRIPDLNGYSEKLSKYSTNIVIKKNGEIAGFIFFYNNNMDSKVAYISQLCVKKEFRHQGIGMALLDACEKIVLGSMNKIELEVNINNENAIKLYTKAGFMKKSDNFENKSIYMIKLL